MSDEDALALFAECSKNLVTVGSSLIVTAYVAFAQFSHQSGELSVLQSRAFFRYVLTPILSGIGFLLLLLSCGLSGDKAPWQMVCASLAAFVTASVFHGIVLVRMYRWAKDPSSKVSPSLSGEGVRARYVRRLLIKDRSTTSDVKLGYVLEHFEKLKNEGQEPSISDKKYAVRLCKVVIRKSYKRFIRAAELAPRGPFAEGARKRLELNIQHTSRMFSLSNELPLLWYDTDFSRSLVIRTRHRPGLRIYGLWHMRDFWVSFLKATVPIGHSPDWLHVSVIDATLSEASKDFYFDDKGGLVDDASFVDGRVMKDVFGVIFSGECHAKVEALVDALRPENNTAFAYFVRSRLRDYLNDNNLLVGLAESLKFDQFARDYLEDISPNHLLRIIRLEKDILNQDVRRFVDLILLTLSQGSVTYTDENADIDALYLKRRRAAELFCLPITSCARTKDLLHKMKESLKHFAEESKASGKQREYSGAIKALKFLEEHWDYLEDRERQRGA
jgi:hypothetical protein